MDIFGIDIGQIVELGTKVATGGVMRVGELVTDEIFDNTAGLAILIYETFPPR